MDIEDAHSLANKLNWLDLGSCSCDYAWRSLGTLYKVNMGKDWLRVTTNPSCEHHGLNAKNPLHRLKGN